MRALHALAALVIPFMLGIGSASAAVPTSVVPTICGIVGSKFNLCINDGTSAVPFATFDSSAHKADLLVANGAFSTVAGSTVAPNGINFTMSAGVPLGDQSVGPKWSVTNSSALPGLGQAEFYYSSNTTGPNFDVGVQEVMYVQGSIAGGNVTVPNYQSHWLVHVGPYNTTASYTSVVEEMNMVNRSNDVGYQPDVTATAQLTGGLRFIPESNTFGPAGTGHNVTFGVHVGHSAAQNTLNKFVKSYNPFGIEYDSIGPGGVGYLAEGGRTDPGADDPLSPLVVLGRFGRGIDFTTATIADLTPLRMNTGQQIGWTNGTGTANLAGSCSGATCNMVVSGTNAIYPFTATSLGIPANPWANLYVAAAGAAVMPFATPASSSAACTQGQVENDASFEYVCVATNTWKRAALTAF